MRKGQWLVIIGLLLAGTGAVQLAFVLRNTLPVLSGEVRVVEYAQYMVEAAVLVHSVLFVVLLIPGAVLIYLGKRSMRRTQEATHA